MPPKISLVGLTRAQIAEVFADDPRPKMRASQVAKWVYMRAVGSFEEMTDLPAELRTTLEKHYTVSPLETTAHLHSSDGVDKLLVHGGDQQGFECVLLPYPERVSCCISSQVGCAMGCTFCATGLGGFDRNLTAGEIVAQYLLLQRLSPKRISHVVYMGMGEPLQNYENVVQSLKLFHEEVGLSYRHLTVSTVGIVPQIRRLAKEGLPIHLAISLHSPFDEIRESMMPVDKRYPVAELMESARYWFSETSRKVTFEYLLIDGVTDTIEQAEELARLVKGLPCLVNLIPFNFVDTGQGFRRPSGNRVNSFRRALEAKRIPVSQRMERGHDIAAACGQLKGEHEGRFGPRRKLSEIPVSS